MLREFIPRSAVQYAARAVRRWAAPLLEPERRTAAQTRIADSTHPILAIWTGNPFAEYLYRQRTPFGNRHVVQMAPALATDNHPLDTAEIRRNPFADEWLHRQEPDRHIDLAQDVQSESRAPRFNRCPSPEIIRQLAPLAIRQHRFRAFGQHLILVLGRIFDHIHNLIAVAIRDFIPKQIAHAVDENQRGRFDLVWFIQLVRTNGQVKTVGEGCCTTLILGKRHGIAEFASLADLLATRYRIPGEICPIDRCFVHLRGLPGLLSRTLARSAGSINQSRPRFSAGSLPCFIKASTRRLLMSSACAACSVVSRFGILQFLSVIVGEHIGIIAQVAAPLLVHPRCDGFGCRVCAVKTNVLRVILRNTLRDRFSALYERFVVLVPKVATARIQRRTLVRITHSARHGGEQRDQFPMCVLTYNNWCPFDFHVRLSFHANCHLIKQLYRTRYSLSSGNLGLQPQRERA